MDYLRIHSNFLFSVSSSDGCCDVFAKGRLPYRVHGAPQSLQSLSHKCTHSLHLEVPIDSYIGGPSQVPHPTSLSFHPS